MSRLSILEAMKKTDSLLAKEVISKGEKIVEKTKMIQSKNGAERWGAGTKTISRLFLSILAFIILGSTLPAGAAEEETAKKDGWQFQGNLYMWGSGIGGKTATGDNIDVSFSDLVKKLNLGFMGGAGVRNGRWSLNTDVMYMKLKANNNGQVTAPIGPGVDVKVDADLDFQAWIITPVLGYSIIDNDRVRLDIIGGARYFFLKPTLDLSAAIGPFQPRNRTISGSKGIWDGVGGVRGFVNVYDKWYVPYYVDLGAGDSAFTWQGMGGVGYRISKAVDMVAVYRYMYWKFDKNKVLDKLDLSGPMVGIIVRF